MVDVAGRSVRCPVCEGQRLVPLGVGLAPCPVCKASGVLKPRSQFDQNIRCIELGVAVLRGERPDLIIDDDLKGGV